MSGRRILVTGAAGFVGSHVLAELARAGYALEETFPLTRPGEHLPAPHPNVLYVDIANGGETAKVVTQLAPTAIVHLAAISEPAKAQSDSRDAWSINLSGVMNLAEPLLASSPSGRFIFAGTSESYGESFRSALGPISEDAPLRPTTVYAATKAAAEIYLSQRAHNGLRVVRFRAFNHTGPGQTPSFVAPAFAQQIARIEKGLQPPVIKVGNLEAERDFLHVRDVARAYVLALEHPLDVGPSTVMNLSSGTPRRISAILDMMLRDSSPGIEIAVDRNRQRPSDLPRAVGDNRRAKALIGWEPTISFEQTIAEVLADWRARAAP